MTDRPSEIPLQDPPHEEAPVQGTSLGDASLDDTRPQAAPAAAREEDDDPAMSPSPLLWAMGGFLLAALLAVGLLLDPLGLHSLDDRLRGAPGEAAAGETLYTCPMHPEIVESEPGSCPICGMDLVAVEGDAAAHDHGATAAAAGEELYTCPMHPEIVESEPGSCPICGMDLVEMEGEGGDAAGDAAGDRVAAGRSIVRLDPAVIQRMNVETEPAALESLSRPVRATAVLEMDPEEVVSVTTRYSGFVERVWANVPGEPVRRGEPLFSVYSPELVQTQEELLSALRYARRLEASSGEGDRGAMTGRGDGGGDHLDRARSLVEAARSRLAFWDISDAQVARLEETGEVQRTLTVASPITGVVVERQEGLSGRAIQPGMPALTLADLGTLLTRVQVYESDLGRVGEGSRVTFTVPAFPGETFSGTVRFVEPSLDPVSRAANLLVEVANPRRRLRPGMYAEALVEPEGSRGPAVTIPSQAVLMTGRRELVVLSLGGGRFAPREVTTGREEGGRVEVLEGLAAGDQVVTSAQFLIDSESNLRAAIRDLTSRPRGSGEAGGSGASGDGG